MENKNVILYKWYRKTKKKKRLVNRRKKFEKENKKD